MTQDTPQQAMPHLDWRRDPWSPGDWMASIGGEGDELYACGCGDKRSLKLCSDRLPECLCVAGATYAEAAAKLRAALASHIEALAAAAKGVAP